MIRIRGLTCAYGQRTALCDVSLDVGRGESVGILGPNGSGKTTLLLALAGVIKPHQGRIEINGTDIAHLPARRIAQMAASVPQRIETPFGLRVLSLVLMGRHCRVSALGGYTQDDERVALDALAEAGAAHLADRRADELSGGELQRVLIARALAQQAEILLLDEATAHLDAAGIAETAALFFKKNRAGMTLVFAMHDLNLAAMTCGRLVFLKAGRLALQGPTRDVFTAENLSGIYETPIAVSRHPAADAPQAHLVPLACPGPDSCD